MVSLVELDWERERIYLLSSIASLLLVFHGELMRRRKVKTVPAARLFKAEDGLPWEAYIAGSPNADNRAGYLEKVKSTNAAVMSEVASSITTQSGQVEKGQLLDCA
jgi:hypothetical protein